MSHSVGRTMLAYHRQWRHINAENQIVGRLATNIAALLMGKHKPIYDPASDCGDHVVVTNSRYLLMTGRKVQDKVYYKHSGRPGHLKVMSVQQAIDKKGTGDILRRAVSGMLPKNKLRIRRLERLRIFEGDQAGHCIRNVVKRFDDIAISPPKQKTKESVVAEDVTLEVANKTRRRATRQNDTPPLGSLGGQLPKALYRPKPKVIKVKVQKPNPGRQRIFDSEGKEWGRRKPSKTTANIAVES